MLTEFKLNLIAARAKKEKSFKFNNLMHIVDEWNLKSSFYQLKRSKAAGVDGITMKKYEENLDENVRNLLGQMKQMSYKPQPVRRKYIPKGNGKLRGLGIPTIEDKMVQMAMSRILTAIFEQDFLNCSYGFRPGKNCHQALAMVDHFLMRKSINYVIDADIKGFFDHVDHQALKRCLETRIKDEKFLRYIVRFLRSGIMEEGEILQTERGTPQGGNISPILSNIYLHYALDRWFYKELKPKMKGYVEIVRYADDFIILAEHKEDAERTLVELKNRLRKCHLELSEEKTQMVSFGRNALKEYEKEKDKRNKGRRPEKPKKKPGTFNFLGFTHYCCRNRKGAFKVGRKTEKKRFSRGLKEAAKWLRQQRNTLKLKEIWNKIAQKLAGHYQYYGVSENYRQINNFYEQMQRLLHKWLKRRSQRRSFSWEQFKKYHGKYPLPLPKIRCDLRRYALYLCREQ